MVLRKITTKTRKSQVFGKKEGNVMSVGNVFI